ncbi:MAG: hypothetical protein OXH09_09500, partial [Gammaproteobacteria bacterium]|nr:hypothetical protein [Gammaproteobacteria bacterium]
MGRRLDAGKHTLTPPDRAEIRGQIGIEPNSPTPNDQPTSRPQFAAASSSGSILNTAPASWSVV